MNKFPLIIVIILILSIISFGIYRYHIENSIKVGDLYYNIDSGRANIDDEVWIFPNVEILKVTSVEKNKIRTSNTFIDSKGKTGEYNGVYRKSKFVEWFDKFDKPSKP